MPIGGSLALTETTWDWSANMFLGCRFSNLEMSDFLDEMPDLVLECQSSQYVLRCQVIAPPLRTQHEAVRQLRGVTGL
jgi:hypothetical protein